MVQDLARGGEPDGAGPRGLRRIVDRYVARTTEDDGAHVRAVAQGGLMTQDRQVHQLVAAEHAAWSVDMAREVVRDAVAMAEASVLLHVVSNVATAVSYMNPKIEMRYVEPVAPAPGVGRAEPDRWRNLG